MIYRIQSQRLYLRIGAAAFVTGLTLFFVASIFHPSEAPAWVSELAFAEYALSTDWIDAHVGQFIGALILLFGFVALHQHLQIDDAPASAIAWFGFVTTVVTIGIVTILQAVDGPALKFVVDRWADAPVEEKDAAFRVAEAVRWIEIGINSYFRIMLGVVLVLFGAALSFSQQFPRWLGWIAVVGGTGSIWQGLFVGHHGFDTSNPAVSIPALIYFAWFAVAAVLMWRRSASLQGLDLLARQAAR
jgi:hypothetical protein